VKYILALSTVLALFACGGSTVQNTSELTSGDWIIQFYVEDSTKHVDIPVYMNVDSVGNFTLVNGTERISIQEYTHLGDSVSAKIKPYLSSLHWKVISKDSIHGYWQDESRENYKINFSATPFKGSYNETKMWSGKTFDVTFSPECADCSYKAVGVFSANSNYLIGTFLTETGDYRYLQGRVDGGNDRSDFYLSCFDGAHLFYFTGNIVGDSIHNGMFYSGKHYSEKWNARLDDKATLRDPDSLTFMKPDYIDLVFDVKNLAGDSVKFDAADYLGKVTVVQIMGTWCPNCSDETRFWSAVKSQLGESLQIVPVAFERGTDTDKQMAALKNYKEQFNLPYEVYLGGEISKDNASRVFPAINAVMSYPTSIIIDKKGKVRKIHTGFYGPSTGKFHDLYTERLRMFVEQLLKEG
jgi:thiol-disulfide isomerase/thioredoxin